jgi:hypothetical protein
MNIIKKNDKPINELLQLFIKKNDNIFQGLAILDIESLFREKMGKVVSSYTKEIFLKGSILYIHVVSAPLKSELQFSKESLMTFLNKEIGSDMINEIRFI